MQRWARRQERDSKDLGATARKVMGYDILLHLEDTGTLYFMMTPILVVN